MEQGAFTRNTKVIVQLKKANGFKTGVFAIRPAPRHVGWRYQWLRQQLHPSLFEWQKLTKSPPWSNRSSLKLFLTSWLTCTESSFSKFMAAPVLIKPSFSKQLNRNSKRSAENFKSHLMGPDLFVNVVACWVAYFVELTLSSFEFYNESDDQRPLSLQCDSPVILISGLSAVFSTERISWWESR